KRGKCWYIDVEADGRRFRKAHGKHKKFAELYLKDIELKIAREELKIPTDAAIDEFFENFLKYAGAHVKPKSLEKFNTVINCFEDYRSRFRTVNKVSKISAAFIENFKMSLAAKVSNGTVNHYLKILSIIFNWAVQHNVVKGNPVKDVRRFKVNTKEPRFFSREEIKLILSSCPARWYPDYMVLLHTGMRRGELANLEWSDVDFERRIIRVAAKDGWSPKGKKEREIPINEELLKLMVALKKKSRGKHVIEKGGIKRYDRALWENFWRLTKRLGIRNASIHTFRHTFASYLIMSGVDLVTVKELLGHRDITTTMRYAHLVPSHKLWAVNRICSLSQNGTNLAQSRKFAM
ncbi:MAG: tyrosine-type recombinase/integrase, partial [Candidatus Aminicenantes bacterium]|nr:tyrosine-type recombinase/integrase [Candidatus Aminicenantes bacterium]